MYRVAQAQWAAKENRLSRCVTEQPGHSILRRGAATHAPPVAEEYGLGADRPSRGSSTRLTHLVPTTATIDGTRRFDLITTVAALSRPSRSTPDRMPQQVTVSLTTSSRPKRQIMDGFIFGLI